MFALRSLFIRSVVGYYMVYMCHVLTHLSVEMRIFALCVMTILLTIYSTLNLVVATVFARFQSALSTDLLAQANALREIILVRDGVFVLSNANHLSINDLIYIIESLAIDLN